MTLVERLSGAVVAGLVVASLMAHVVPSHENPADVIVRAENTIAEEAIAVGYPEHVLWDYLAQQSDVPIPPG